VRTRSLFPFSILYIALSTLFVAQAAEPKDPLEYWLADSAPFWRWDPDTFIQQAKPLGFEWSTQNRSARAAPLKGAFFDKPVLESIVRFEDGSPNSILLSYYNRGDAKHPMSEEAFKQTVRELVTTISRTLNVRPRPGTRKSRRNDVRDDSRVWQRPDIKFELAYSYTPGPSFRAEYIRLTAQEFKPTEIPSHARDRVNPYEVRKNVTRDAESGDVWIANIPMVDQGPKGYCAAAGSERILRFFGQEVDQHEVAQVANTTSGGGTSVDALKKALQAVGRQYGFKFNSHMEWDFEDFLDEMEDYNREADKRGFRQVYIPEVGVIHVGQIYMTLNPEIFKAVRTDQKSEYRKFREKVREYVNAGCPLAWCVTLGLFQESIPTGAGGHMRLIIGYNTKDDTLIYSDTWGPGHQKKSMPMDQAFTITTSLFSLEPKGLRL